MSLSHRLLKKVVYSLGKYISDIDSLLAKPVVYSVLRSMEIQNSECACWGKWKMVFLYILQFVSIWRILDLHARRADKAFSCTSIAQAL